jgi:hypothetical protein
MSNPPIRDLLLGLLTQYAETEIVKEAASIGTRLSRFVS